MHRGALSAGAFIFLGVSALHALAAPDVAEGPDGAERALALDLDGSGRSAIVFRAESGDGAVVFRPTIDGGFSLELYPGMGTEVTRIAVGDVDHDARPDLLFQRQDGSFATWLGDGSGRFLPEPEIGAPMHHAGHVPPPTKADREDLRSIANRGDVPATASIDIDGGGAPDVAFVTRDGSVVLRRGEHPDHPVDLGSVLPGFKPRFVIAGHFRGSDRPELAVIGAGERPRLVLLARGESSDLDALEMLAPTATFMVNVGQGGFNFVPNSVTIQTGDTVQWTWSTSGHNVVSGNPCTANNLFCSPSNTSCSTTSTSAAGATYSRVFPLAGSFPYFCNPHCGFGMTGTVQVQAPASPGAVPKTATVPGTPLTLGKSGSDYTAQWGASCSAGAINYALYEGTIPIVAGVYSHGPKNCNLGNVTNTTFTTTVDNAYYLIVPETASNEGSYGRSTAGEIPALGGSCRPQTLTPCP